jgi:hypothetical protein
MRVTTAKVRKLSRECDIPEDVIERHMDQLLELVFRTAKRQRNMCANKIKAWYFSHDMTKPQLFEVLTDNEEEDIL